MYDPKSVLTVEGYETYINHVLNMRNAVDFIVNHYDDLHIGEHRSERTKIIEDFVFSFGDLKEMLINGDGEKE